MFSKLAAEDEFERKQIIQNISSDILGEVYKSAQSCFVNNFKILTTPANEMTNLIIHHFLLEMAKSELHSVKLFLSTILRLAHRSPFTEVSENMKTLLGNLEV